jgi:hypothetical protein
MRKIIAFLFAFPLFVLAAIPAQAGQVQRQSAPGMSREYVVISDNQIEGPVIRSGATVLRGKLTVSQTGYDSFQMYDGVFKLIARHLVEVDFYTGEPLPAPSPAACPPTAEDPRVAELRAIGIDVDRVLSAIP